MKAEAETTGRKRELPDCFSPGSRLPSSWDREQENERFTDTELQAAANLVLLSESSSGSTSMGKEGTDGQGHPVGAGARTRGWAAHSCSSDSSSQSLASVNTKHPAASRDAVNEEEVGVGESAGAGTDEDTASETATGHCKARARRYRSLRGLYRVTPRMDRTPTILTQPAARLKRTAVPERKAAVKMPTVAEGPKRKTRVW